jgi:hypothetical protein
MLGCRSPLWIPAIDLKVRRNARAGQMKLVRNEEVVVDAGGGGSQSCQGEVVVKAIEDRLIRQRQWGNQEVAFGAGLEASSGDDITLDTSIQD